MGLEEIEDSIYYQKVKQKTIDLVQNAITDFGEDQEYSLDELGAYIYEVSICIEVYNPSLEKEIDILTDLKAILERKYEIKSGNNQTEDIREVHFDGWKKNNKFIDIDVTELESKRGWVGTCRTMFDFSKYRETKILTIEAMRTELFRLGYEVGNLPELMGIK